MSQSEYGLITLVEVFNWCKRTFRIPDYQRGYSWENTQRKDLFQDIENIIEADYSHYTGTVVATPTADRGQYNNVSDECYDVVDGQQRLTTLVMILNEIIHQDESLNSVASEKEVSVRELCLTNEVEPGNTRRLFLLNKEDDAYFYAIIKGQEAGVPQTKSHHNLSNAKSEIGEWLNRPEIDRRKIRDTILGKLGFLFYAPQNTGEVGLMFEVINNRGKPLSQLEKVKNYLVYFGTKNDMPDLVSQVNDTWGNLLKSLSNAQVSSNEEEDNFLRNSWIVFEDHRKSDSYYVYENMKKKYPADGDKGALGAHFEKLKSFIDFLETSSKTYEKLYKQEGGSGDEVRLLLLLSLQSTIASVLPLIVAINSREKKPEIRVRLLDLIEKLNFRYYGCHVAPRADTGQGTLFWLAHKYYNKYNQEDKNEDSEKVVIDSSWLEGELLSFVKARVPDADFVKSLTLDKDEHGDYYSWGSLKYFLVNYEWKLNRGQDRDADIKKMMAPQRPDAKQDFYQLEHIWAVNENSIDKNTDERHINKRRLGNFVLLEPKINQSVGKIRIEDKIGAYFDADRDLKSHAAMLYELKPMYDDVYVAVDKEWSRKTYNFWLTVYTQFFDQREVRLVNFALDRWAVPYSERQDLCVRIDSTKEGNEIYEFVPKK